MSFSDFLPVYRGKPVQLPLDLFIPPDALEIWLEAFEGPLDLLLYIIRKNNFDILDIPIAEVTYQYTEYVNQIENNRFELASDYLVMAAWLAEIKSRLLLPKHPLTEEEEEHDPRQELIARLQLYAQYKEAAENLEALPQFGKDIYPIHPALPDIESRVEYPQISIDDLTKALKRLLRENIHYESHIITPEHLSIQERMVHILEHLSDVSYTQFELLIDSNEGRLGIVITFMAILELAKQNLIDLVQEKNYTNITLKLIN